MPGVTPPFGIDQSIAGATLGAGGGDVTGTIPGPLTVVGIDGKPITGGPAVSGDILIFNGTSWNIRPPTAADVDYVNTTSGLAATDVQAAIDEVVANSMSAGMVPYYIAVGHTFTVPVNYQALFAVPITGPGALVVHGILKEVS